MSARRLGTRERSLLYTLWGANRDGVLPTRGQLIIADNGGSEPYTRTKAGRWWIINKLAREGMVKIVQGEGAARLMITDAGVLTLGAQ